MTTKRSILLIRPGDNVAVALRPLEKAETIDAEGQPIRVAEPVPEGHKIALRPIAEGSDIVKYGFPIGRATSPIETGAWVHEHNVRTALEGTGEFTYEPNWSDLAPIDDHRTFDGFVRTDGQVGIRNEIWIIPTVGCVNDAALAMAGLLKETPLPETVDAVVAFPHPLGCSQHGEERTRTRKVLARLARHPNAGGVLVLGLGCEDNTMDSMREEIGDADANRVRFLVAQDVKDELESGLEILHELSEVAGSDRRETLPVSRLRVGLECGGSDGFSGLTANPLAGAVTDRLVARGATVVLTEVPEIFGAEQVILGRCADREVFEETARMINDYRAYFIRHGQPISDNPSPGNHDGGLTTLEEKSLGCIQKAGTGPVTGMIRYGDALRVGGLNILEGPGGDNTSCTGLAAAGVHLTLFTTGRGTPLGGPVPTLKIATNSALADRKPNWIDIDAGPLLEGETMDRMADRLFDMLLDVASGRSRTRSEINASRTMAIWNGVTA